MGSEVIFLDLEGTLLKKAVPTASGNTAQSVWPRVSQALGDACWQEVRKLTDKWNRGEYESYLAWAEETVLLHQKHGLTKDVFEEVLGSVHYNEGVPETISFLKANGYKTAIISGGFKAHADKVQRELSVDHAFATCRYVWGKDGELVGWNLLPSDYEGKVDFMRVVARWYGKTSDQCIYVGDGINDRFAMQAAGTAIGFNANENVRPFYQHDVRGNFTGILRHVPLLTRVP